MDKNCYYTFNGFIVHDLSEVPDNAIITAHPRLLGGKGGFGSMLRAIGSQIEKTTNREMCRDLSGRRMRDVNNEKKFKEWLDKADERERSKIEQYLEKRRKRKFLLEQGPSATVPFEDKTSNEKRQQIAEELQEAIDEAFAKLDKKVEIEVPTKAKNLNMGIDSDLESSSSSSCPSPIRDTSESIATGSVEQVSAENNVIPKKIQNLDEINENVEEPMVKKIRMDATMIEENIEEPDVTKAEESNENNMEESDAKKLEEKEVKQIEKLEFETGNKDIVDYPPINLDECGSVASLLTFDLDWIKQDLLRRGLKCGGTLMERAQRLFSCKGLDPQSYPASILAGSTNNRKRK